MRFSISAAVAALILVLVGCTATDQPVNIKQKDSTTDQYLKDTKDTALLHWRDGHQCDSQMRWWWDNVSGDAAQPCVDNNKDLITVSLSGGGTKAAIFSAESMFYLDAIGLLPRVSMISSVSGGSFASAYYALSCDINDPGCFTKETSNKQAPPRWDYDLPKNPDPDNPNNGAFQYIGYGFADLLGDGKLRLFTNHQDPVSPTEFAAFIDQHYFNSKIIQSDVEHSLDISKNFKFKDRNVYHRPNLVLNTTLINDLRFLSENAIDGNHGLGFLRRRNADEFYHFAFTNYYFGRIDSNLDEFPLGYAVAASGAFPMLIGTPLLKDFQFCDSLHSNVSLYHSNPEAKSLKANTCKDDNLDVMRLTDGGANDNQGLLEVFLTYAELMNDESRSVNSTYPHRCDHRALPETEVNLNLQAAKSQLTEDLWLAECLKGGDRGLALVVNSSITEATGESLTDSAILKTLVGTADRVSAAIDVYSGGGYNLRKRLFKSDLDAANGKIHRAVPNPDPNKMINVDIVEVGLMTLDDYPEGGHEAALLELALLDEAGTDESERARRLRQLDINALQDIGADRGNTGRCYSPNGSPDALHPVPCQTYQQIQSEVFEYMTHQNRENLGLGHVHPQCLFEQSKFTEMGLTSLASMDKKFGVCLRHAARFATALRGEELCQRTANGSGFYTPLNDQTALRCEGGHLKRLTATALDKFRSLGDCEMDEKEWWQNVKVRTSLLTNEPFVNELKMAMGGRRSYKDKGLDQPKFAAWQEQWRKRFPHSTMQEAPDSPEDFIAHYPLSEVCDLHLYSPDIPQTPDLSQ